MSSSLRPFLWWPFPSLAPAICSKLRQKGISVSLRPLPPSSPVISRYLTQSHRIAPQGWQKDLTLQHEHDSWVTPPPDWPRQTSASPAESMSPRSLTYWHTKGGPNLWQARRPLSPKERKEMVLPENGVNRRGHTEKTTWTTFTTSNNSFGKPWAELSLLKLCHGEKECHEME